jgi:hypothetical protein
MKKPRNFLWMGLGFLLMFSIFAGVLNLAKAADDLYEDNDTQAFAKNIPFGRTNNLVYNDEDWYKVSLMYNETFNFKIWTYGAYFSVEFFNITGSKLDMFGGAGSSLSRIFTCMQYPEMTLDIHIVGTTVGSVYDLDLYTNRQNPYDDMFENNDNQTESKLMPYEFHRDLRLFDEDWYQFAARANYNCFFQLQTGEFYFEMELYNQSGYITKLGGASGSLTLNYTAPMNGPLFIRIIGDYIGRTYNFWAWYDNLNYIALDPYENDDNFEQNYYAGNGNFTVNNGVQWDDDYFKLQVGAHFAVNITLQYNFNIGNLSLTVYNENYTSFGLQSSNTGTEKFDMGPIPYAREYYIRVTGNNTGVNYTMNILQRFIRIDDSIEPYNDKAHAYFLQNTNTSYFNLMQFDADYFKIGVDPNLMLLVIIDCMSNAPIVLFDEHPTESRIIRNESSTFDGQLMFEFGAQNQYNEYIIAVKGNNEGAPYNITFQFLPANPSPTSSSSNTGTSSTQSNTNTNSQSSDQKTSGTTDFENPFGSIPGYPLIIFAFFSGLTVIWIFRTRKIR